LVAEALLAAADEEIDGLIAEVPPHEGDGGPGQNVSFAPASSVPRSEDVLRRSLPSTSHANWWRPTSSSSR
jgi:hypothetical protein